MIAYYLRKRAWLRSRGHEVGRYKVGAPYQGRREGQEATAHVVGADGEATKNLKYITSLLSLLLLSVQPFGYQIHVRLPIGIAQPSPIATAYETQKAKQDECLI